MAQFTPISDTNMATTCIGSRVVKDCVIDDELSSVLKALDLDVVDTRIPKDLLLPQGAYTFFVTVAAITAECLQALSFVTTRPIPMPALNNSLE